MNFISLGATFFHTERQAFGRTDITKVIVDFYNFGISKQTIKHIVKYNISLACANNFNVLHVTNKNYLIYIRRS